MADKTLGLFSEVAQICDYYDRAALRWTASQIETFIGADGKEYCRLNLPQRFVISDLAKYDTNHENLTNLSNGEGGK